MGQRVLQEALDAGIGTCSEGDGARRHRGLDILIGQHRDHPLHPSSRAGVNVQEAGMGVRAAHHGRVQHVWQFHVINELAGPGEKSPVLFAANGSTDVSLGHPGILLKPASVSSRFHAPAPGEC